MENNFRRSEELKNRYIYAVIRHLPIKMQADVERELDGLISDMLEERYINNTERSVGDQYPAKPAPPHITEQNIKDILTELGSPEELALKYYGGEQKSLISGVYFLMYKRILRICLPIIASVISILTAVAFFINSYDSQASFIVGIVNIADFNFNPVGLFFRMIINTIGGVIQAFAVITIIFAILDYKKVNLKDNNLSNLPQVPDEKSRIGVFWPIFGIVFSISTTALLLGAPQIIGTLHYNLNNFEWIPALDVEAIRSLWFPIILWTIIEVVAEIMKLTEGQYTKRLAAFTLITSILQVICLIIVFGNDNIINPDFLDRMIVFAEGIPVVDWLFLNIFSQPNLIIMGIIFIVLLFETLEVVIKGFQSRGYYRV